MPIVSVTHIAGGPRSGKSFLATKLNTYPNHYLVEEDSRTKEDIRKLLDDWKVSTIERNVVLIGDRIYQFIDYDFGAVTHYYISCDKKNPLVISEEKEHKPLFE